MSLFEEKCLRNSVDENLSTTHLLNEHIRSPSLKSDAFDRIEIPNKETSSPQLERNSDSVQTGAFLKIGELLCNQFVALEWFVKLADRNQLTVERLMNELNHINNEALEKFSSINELHASFLELRILCIKLGIILSNVANEIGKEFKGNETDSCSAAVVKASNEDCAKREELGQQADNLCKPSDQTAKQHAQDTEMSSHAEAGVGFAFESEAVRCQRESCSNVPSSRSGDSRGTAQQINDSLDIHPESAEMEKHAAAASIAGAFQENTKAKMQEVIGFSLPEHNCVGERISPQDEKLQQAVSACSTSCMLTRCRQGVLQLESKAKPSSEDGFSVDRQKAFLDSAACITRQRISRYFKFTVTSVSGLQGNSSSSQSEMDELLGDSLHSNRTVGNKATVSALSHCSKCSDLTVRSSLQSYRKYSFCPPRTHLKNRVIVFIKLEGV